MAEKADEPEGLAGNACPAGTLGVVDELFFTGVEGVDALAVEVAGRVSVLPGGVGGVLIVVSIALVSGFVLVATTITGSAAAGAGVGRTGSGTAASALAAMSTAAGTASVGTPIVGAGVDSTATEAISVFKAIIRIMAI